MANTLMSLLVKIGVDTKGLQDGLGGVEQKITSSTASIGKGLVTVGGSIAGAAALAGAGAALFLASTIKPASDLNETISKVGVVFGESAADVLAFGTTAANALGMSQNAALSAAGTYGNLFRAMGMTEETSASMSVSLVTLAGDLASFNNMDPTEVLDKLRAGLSGETEPLRSLGVNLNQALIEQEAFNSGIWDGIEPINAAQKAQATYALIMEQTTLAQGDFARTSEGVANQQRIMAANFVDIKAKIGTALLPMLSTLSQMLVAVFSDPKFKAGLDAVIQGISNFAASVIEKIPVVIAAFQNMSAWFTNNKPIVIGILAAIGVALLAFGVNAAIAGAMALFAIWPIVAVIAAIIAVVALLYTAWTQNWGGIQEKAAAAWESIKAAVSAGVGFIKNIISGAMTFISNLTSGKLGLWSTIWKNTFEGIKGFINTIITNLKLIFSLFTLAVSGDWTKFGETLRKIWENTWNGIRDFLSSAVDNIKAIFSETVQYIMDVFLNTDWAAVGQGIINGIINGVSALLTSMYALFEDIVAAILSILGGLFNGPTPPADPLENFPSGFAPEWLPAPVPAMAYAGGESGLMTQRAGESKRGIVLNNYGTITVAKGSNFEEELLAAWR